MKKRIIALLLTVATVLTLLPLSVSAASCSHSYGGTRWADAVHPHGYFYFCENGCGAKQYTGTYMTKSNCAVCNPSIGTCYHTGNTWTDSAHPHVTVCTNCCAALSYDTVSGCAQCCSHYYGYTYTDSTHYSYGHKQYFTCYSCGDESYSGTTSYYSSCTTCNPPVVSSVSLYASGPRGNIYSSGSLEATSLPATFTVYADTENCSVTSMYYYDNGTKITSYSDSISYTAYTYDDFDSFTVYVNTTTGVSDSISVNFHFVRYAEAAIKWEYTGAVIRKITQNGKTIRSGLSTEIEFQVGGDLTDSAYDTITGLVNSYDGKTYILSGSSLIRVYRPSDNSTIGNYDTYSDFDALCNVAGWTTSTLNAFESARTIEISYQAPKAVEGTATWQTTSGTVLKTQTAASASGYSYIRPNQSITVTYNASTYAPSGYTYKGMEWSCGSDTGSSTTKTSYSKAYNTSTSPVNVTFLYEKTPTSGSITVNAYDADTKARIPSVRITCGSKSSTSNPATFTGLSFKGYDVAASADGYMSASGYASISADDPTQTVDLFLFRNSGDVTVYVYDADTNRPISGASISGAASGMTNSSGYCSFSGISFTGSHTFTASKSGYYPGSASTTLSRNKTSDTLYIYLEPLPKTGNIYVTVYDAETYDTISGAYVSGAGDYNYTNSYGNAYFYDVPFGNYYFSASADGYYSDSAYAYISESSQSDSISIYLTPIPTEGDITVYVRDADTNAVISGASVSGGGYSKTTNSSGYVTFSDIPLSSYTFTASKSGYFSNTGSATISTSSTDKTITIYLDPHPTEGDITVYVKNKDTGAVISGASVSGGGYSKTTNSSGYATFSDIPLSSYTFTASKSGFFSNSGSASISVNSTTATVTIYLTPHPTEGDITVYVKDKDTGAALSGATVSGGGYSKTTNSSGVATFADIPLKAYTFTASLTGYKSGSGSATISINDTDESITIYLEKKKADVSITADAVNGTIYKGSTIIVSAEVVGDANMDFTPSNPLTVTMTATRNGGSVFASASKSVICPAGSSNLVWFEVDIPESGYSSDDIKFTFKVSTPSDVAESSTANNTITKNERAVKLPDRESPDASFELTPPSSFRYSEYKTNSTPTLSWSVWEWNGGFVRKTYTAKLTLSAKLIPDASAGYRKESGGKWTTRSGYGLNTEVSVGLSATNSAMVVGDTKVNVYYPEHNYSTNASSSDMLELSGGKYVFKVNDGSLNGSRYHATPLWFPDGSYSLKYHVYDKWCPAGMLTGYTYASVTIDGSMYDDLYTN